MNERRRQFTLALVSLLGMFSAWEPPANAQSYPVRPVKIIVPGAAGGPGDTITRSSRRSWRKRATAISMSKISLAPPARSAPAPQRMRRRTAIRS
jgi:tripartite-type tricarboxylate transporter receptor subunit TctC